MRKAVFCAHVKRIKKEEGGPEAEDETRETEEDAPDNQVDERGRACRQKGWWKRADVEAKLNTVNVTAWVHKECDMMDEEALIPALIKLQEAWNNQEQKDECRVRLDELERAVSGPTAWALRSACWEDMDCREWHWVWMGRAKMGKWGQGAANSGMKEQTHVDGRRRKARAQTASHLRTTFAVPRKCKESIDAATRHTCAT